MSDLAEWLIHFDGACTVNPGGVASYGWCLYDPDGNFIQSGNGIACSGPEATCNVAEYAALEHALRALESQGMRVPLLCRGDSQLVVQQVALRWRCKKPHLAKRRDDIRSLLERVGDPWRIEWIPRRLNSHADYLSKSLPA